MKKLFLLLLAGYMALPAAAQFTKANLQATGLTCAMCSKAINKALQAVPFVESVKSDIKNSSFSMVFKAGAEVDIDALKNAVEDAGFSVGSLAITGLFSETKIEKDQHIKIGSENFHFLNGANQVLKGEHTIHVVDKNFVSEKQFKKYAATTKMDCMQSGKDAGERVYHVTI